MYLKFIHVIICLYSFFLCIVEQYSIFFLCHSSFTHFQVVSLLPGLWWVWTQALWALRCRIPCVPKFQCCLVAKSSPTLSRLHELLCGISQARIPEWVAVPFSRGSSWPRDWTCVSCIGRWIRYPWVTRETRKFHYSWLNTQTWNCTFIKKSVDCVCLGLFLDSSLFHNLCVNLCTVTLALHHHIVLVAVALWQVQLALEQHRFELHGFTYM